MVPDGWYLVHTSVELVAKAVEPVPKLVEPVPNHALFTKYQNSRELFGTKAIQDALKLVAANVRPPFCKILFGNLLKVRLKSGTTLKILVPHEKQFLGSLHLEIFQSGTT